jgi:hypothetical protein
MLGQVERRKGIVIVIAFPIHVQDNKFDKTFGLS